MIGQDLLLASKRLFELLPIAGLFFLFISVSVYAELEQKKRLIHMIRHDCGACHGYTLGGGLGPALTADSLKEKSNAVLLNIIQYGVEGTPMPPWNNILNEQEINWIVEQLKTGLPDE